MRGGMGITSACGSESHCTGLRRGAANAVQRSNPQPAQMTWGTGQGPKGTVRVEDGFLRSRGLGADLVPPLSLIIDDIGLYFDPTRPSGFEKLCRRRISPRGPHPHRAAYNVADPARGFKIYAPARPLPPLPAGQKVLVPGQVEDDASIRLGAGMCAPTPICWRRYAPRCPMP